MKKSKERPEFRRWIDNVQDPDWRLMPLTHITKGIGLQDILRAESIIPEDCETLGKKVSFFFYGRPAYRVSGDGTIKAEATCPACLIFDPSLINSAENIHAFDTGAFGKRMYSKILYDELQMSDFSLETDLRRPNKLIKQVFKSMEHYFDANTVVALKAEEGAESWDFLVKAYLDLINSQGRNEPDDRVCTIEISISNETKLSGQLLAVVVPHTLWATNKQAPWLSKIASSGVEILPYIYVPNRHPEYYNALLEGSVRKYYKDKGYL